MAKTKKPAKAAKKTAAKKTVAKKTTKKTVQATGENLQPAPPEPIDMKARHALRLVGCALSGLSGLDSTEQAHVDAAVAACRAL